MPEPPLANVAPPALGYEARLSRGDVRIDRGADRRELTITIGPPSGWELFGGLRSSVTLLGVASLWTAAILLVCTALWDKPAVKLVVAVSLVGWAAAALEVWRTYAALRGPVRIRLTADGLWLPFPGRGARLERIDRARVTGVDLVFRPAFFRRTKRLALLVELKGGAHVATLWDADGAVLAEVMTALREALGLGTFDKASAPPPPPPPPPR